MKNATLKISTIDKQSISALTVFGFNSDLSIPDIFYPCENKSNQFSRAVICEEIIKNVHNKSSVRTIREGGFAIQIWCGAPFYKYMTYFTGYGKFCNDEVGSLEGLIGESILGFCLSSDENAMYVYDYEFN